MQPNQNKSILQADTTRQNTIKLVSGIICIAAPVVLFVIAAAGLIFTGLPAGDATSTPESTAVNQVFMNLTFIAFYSVPIGIVAGILILKSRRKTSNATN